MATATMTRPTVLPWRLVSAVAGANVLNLLNSSMIAVALLAVSATYGIDIAGATWLGAVTEQVDRKRAEC